MPSFGHLTPRRVARTPAPRCYAAAVVSTYLTREAEWVARFVQGGMGSQDTGLRQPVCRPRSGRTECALCTPGFSVSRTPRDRASLHLCSSVRRGYLVPCRRVQLHAMTCRLGESSSDVSHQSIAAAPSRDLPSRAAPVCSRHGVPKKGQPVAAAF